MSVWGPSLSSGAYIHHTHTRTHKGCVCVMCAYTVGPCDHVCLLYINMKSPEAGGQSAHLVCASVELEEEEEGRRRWRRKSRPAGMGHSP